VNPDQCNSDAEPLPELPPEADRVVSPSSTKQASAATHACGAAPAALPSCARAPEPSCTPNKACLADTQYTICATPVSERPRDNFPQGPEPIYALASPAALVYCSPARKQGAQTQAGLNRSSSATTGHSSPGVIAASPQRIGSGACASPEQLGDRKAQPPAAAQADVDIWLQRHRSTAQLLQSASVPVHASPRPANHDEDAHVSSSAEAKTPFRLAAHGYQLEASQHTAQLLHATPAAGAGHDRLDGSCPSSPEHENSRPATHSRPAVSVHRLEPGAQNAAVVDLCQADGKGTAAGAQPSNVRARQGRPALRAEPNTRGAASDPEKGGAANTVAGASKSKTKRVRGLSASNGWQKRKTAKPYQVCVPKDAFGEASDVRCVLDLPFHLDAQQTCITCTSTASSFS
jgi:hypothetical protein